MPRLLRRKKNPTPSPQRRVANRSAWRELLLDEDQRCASAGFGAGIVTLDFGGSLADPPGPVRTREVLELVDRSVAWTDRYCLVSPNMVAILAMPIGEIHQLERLARRLDTVSREAGIHAAIGWSHRHDSSDLRAAWARADANAAVAHSRHVRLVG